MTVTGGAPRARRVDRLPLVALVVAAVLLVGSLVVAGFGAFGPAPWGPASYRVAPGGQDGAPWHGDGHWNGMMGSRGPGGTSGNGYGGMVGGYGGTAGEGHGMMAGQIWLAGDGHAVTTIAEARARAAQAGQARGLHPGEVMQFTNNFYVELKDSSGAATTEVLVDPASGAVQTEPGPAMMWNTGTRTATLTEEQAAKTAADWLAANRPNEKVQTIDAYPGYYTVDTESSGKMAGMLSVNATTGAVWYHTWHATFVAMEDA